MQHGQGIDTIIFSLRGRIIRVVKESFYVNECFYTVYRFLTQLTISAGSNKFHENSLLATGERRLRVEITLSSLWNVQKYFFQHRIKFVTFKNPGMIAKKVFISVEVACCRNLNQRTAAEQIFLACTFSAVQIILACAFSKRIVSFTLGKGFIGAIFAIISFFFF